MAYNQLRANVRNLMVPMTISEATDYRDQMAASGHTEAAGYADEFIRELEADFNGCECDADFDEE